MRKATIKQGNYPSGRQRWMVQAFLGGERIRRYFTDKEMAIAERDRIDRSSAEAIKIPERILHEAWDCHQRLATTGWTLRDATDHVLQRVVRFQDQAPVEQLVKKYLAEEEASGLKVDSMRDLRSRLNMFSNHFGDKKPYEISIDGIRDWLADLVRTRQLGPASQCNYLTTASQFFRWCIINQRCAENPVSAVKRPKLIPSEIEFYNIDQCRALLELAPEYGLLHYVILGIFPGIRPTELWRLDPIHIRLDRRIIVLNAEVTKKVRRRVIELPVGDAFGDCLFAWLSSRSLPERICAVKQRTFKDHFRALFSALGIKLIQDGLRHTAATYHYAYYGDAIKTSALLGHRGVRILFEHYKGLASRAEAEQFYALYPAPQTAILRRLENNP